MSRILPVLGVAATLLTGAATAQVSTPAPLLRTVYVTVTDRNGLPVDDVAATDFEVKEGGRTATVESAAIATEPLHIAFIVDDNGTGLFRSPLARFAQRMHGQAVMSLRSVVGQTMTVVEYTPSVERLLQGISRMNARPGTPDGGQLLEGISEAAVELGRLEARRPVIIAFTVGGQEHSTVNSDLVLDQLRKSGTALHVFSVAASALRSTVAAAAPRDLLQENMHLSRVLGDGPKQTGGRHQQIVASAGFLLGLGNLASELLGQYRLDYTLPPGAKKSDTLKVSMKRKGLVVRAPSRIPT